VGFWTPDPPPPPPKHTHKHTHNINTRACNMCANIHTNLQSEILAYARAVHIHGHAHAFACVGGGVACESSCDAQVVLSSLPPSLPPLSLQYRYMGASLQSRSIGATHKLAEDFILALVLVGEALIPVCPRRTAVRTCVKRNRIEMEKRSMSKETERRWKRDLCQKRPMSKETGRKWKRGLCQQRQNVDEKEANVNRDRVLREKRLISKETECRWKRGLCQQRQNVDEKEAYVNRDRV